MIQIRDQKYSKKALIERAHELLARGGPFAPAESAIFGACWPLVSEAPIQSLEDAKLHRAARAHHVPERPRRERVATPFDEQIAEAEEKLEAARVSFAEADREYAEAEQRLKDLEGGLDFSRGFWRPVGPRKRALPPGQIDAARAKENEARGAWNAARERLRKALVAANGLRLQADRWRRNEEIRQMQEPEEEAATAA